MQFGRENQPPRKVIEEPKSSLLPYAAVAFVVAFAIWSYEQQDVSEPNRAPTPLSKPPSESHYSDSKSTKGDVRTLFSPDDYPADALRRGEEGTVQAELTVDPRGTVSRCRIVRSSGSATLDKATCGILQNRARFTPARDANGKAVSDRVVTPPVTWRLQG